MGWRSVLYEYVHRRNQAQAERRWEGLDGCLEDGAFLFRLRERSNRAARIHKERNLRPREHETRLRILDASIQEGLVTADIRLHQRIEYEIAGRVHTEERCERERLVFARPAGRWTILSVFAESPEAVLRTRTEYVRRPAQPPQGFPAVNSGAAASPPCLNPAPAATAPDSPASRGLPYDRAKAAAYADQWWSSANPQFLRFEVDCTNFVSQCLFAGRAPMNYTGTRERGWWYRGKSGGQELWSYSWSVAHSLRWFLAGDRTAGLRAHQAASPKDLQIGDVISYDFGGTGRFGHSAIVTEIAADGMPLVNAHTTDCRRRYWDYRDSFAWDENTRYLFLHIAESF